ncbi:MAG: hypothetical protein NTV49_03610 [Kiritimatiellaeota bacterium]|nr:hypothetical protein [Kiritimatiellota bacterium]
MHGIEVRSIILLGIMITSIIIFYGAVLIVLISPLLSFLARRQQRWAYPTCIILLGVSLVALDEVAWFLDAWAGWSASWLFCAIFIVLGVALPASVLLPGRSRLPLGFGGLFVISILVMHYCDFSPVKPYRRFYEVVHTGMTESEVLVLLQRTFPAGGHFRVPAITVSTSDHISFLLDPTDGRYNAEIVSLALREGKVTQKQYFPD